MAVGRKWGERGFGRAVTWQLWRSEERKNDRLLLTPAIDPDGVKRRPTAADEALLLTDDDLDGIAGIYIPGAITRDVAKQSTDQAIQSIRLASLDPSVGAQAASAGIQAAKSLIGRKVKLVKVTVKAGYRVLLRDNKASDNIAN